MEALLLKQKTNPNDSGTITSTALLEGYAKIEDIKIAIENIDKGVSLTRFEIEELFMLNNIFMIANPINISSTRDIETICTNPGTIYFNRDSNELRIRTNTQWKTIQTT